MTTIDVDDLAQIIRQVDGNHDMGAGALAEAILDRLPTPTIIRTVEELEALDPDTVVERRGTVFRTASEAINVAEHWGIDAVLPAVVIRDGAEVRAARKALWEA